MNGGFSAGSDGLWLDVVTIGGNHAPVIRGAKMQTYFYDIHWDRETLIDEEGQTHFDDGSAIYYARVVASRIARCGKGERVRVHVRDMRGRLLSIQCPGPLRALSNQQAEIRSIVERDLARQWELAG